MVAISKLLTHSVRAVFNRDGAFARWCGFSAVSFASVITLTTALREVLGADQRIAFLLPLVIMFFVNFLTLRYFIYRTKEVPIATQFAGYAASAIGFRVTEFVAYWTLVDVFSLHYFVSIVIVLPASFVLKFVVFGSVAFRQRRTSNNLTSLSKHDS
jgi:putative flippase GtrA